MQPALLDVSPSASHSALPNYRLQTREVAIVFHLHHAFLHLRVIHFTGVRLSVIQSFSALTENDFHGRKNRAGYSRPYCVSELTQSFSVICGLLDQLGGTSAFGQIPVR